HLACDLTRFLRRFAEVDTALESIGEGPFPSPACVNLRFHHNLGRCDFARDLFCFLWGGGHFAARCRYPEFPQQLLGLIFVNVHRRRSTTKRGTFAHSIEFLPRTWSRNNRSSLATSRCSCHNGYRESGRGRARVATDPIAMRGSIIRGGHCHKSYCRTARR